MVIGGLELKAETLEDSYSEVKMKAFILARLSEASTKRGFVYLLSALGVSLSPEQAEQIISLGLAIAGVIGIFFPDKVEPGA